MNGYAVFYPFGFDDNGLPTEKYIEKKCNVRPHELGRSEFIKLCLKETLTVEEEFKSLWQRMGLSINWNYWYSTISESTRRISQLSFIKLYKAGYIYRKDEPALYCTTCRTTVAQAELDDSVQSSTFNDIVFTDQDGNKLIIATTRPELLYSTSALLYHPADKRYAHLRGKKAIVPMYETSVPIYADEIVDPEKGSGLVMVSTFGDQKDIEWYKKYNLPLRLSLGKDGKWVEQTGPLAGLKAHDARAKILALLQEKGLVHAQKPIQHSVNVHERCGKEIEYIVLSQWFVKILEYKKEFIELADKITWYPSFMKSRYIDWVTNLKWDWCISRQRYFGIPFPVWHCLACNTIILAEEKNLPIDPQETNPTTKCSCGSNTIQPDMDVMDTWNTSSLTPYICYNLFKPTQDPFDKEALTFIPMGMRPQAHDIIRTWAFDTIVKVWMHNKTVPWNQIVISGHVTLHKEKISKSKGNNPLAPENLLKQYSADVLRYWTASGSLGHDISFSETQLKIGQRLVTKLWNAFLFAQPHLQNYIPSQQPKHLGIVNEWILTSASHVFKEYKAYFTKHEFGLALNKIEQFFWSDFCDNYLELIKHQLFNTAEYKASEIESTKWTLYTVGLEILQLYAPYVPFITDAIFKEIYASNTGIQSIHTTKFANHQIDTNYEQAFEIMTLINNGIGQVRKLKSEYQLSLKTTIHSLVIHGEKAKNLQPYQQLIKGVSQALSITFSDEVIDTPKLIQDNNQLIIYINI